MDLQQAELAKITTVAKERDVLLLDNERIRADRDFYKQLFNESVREGRAEPLVPPAAALLPPSEPTKGD